MYFYPYLTAIALKITIDKIYSVKMDPKYKEVRIKWPNDLVIQDKHQIKKLCGTLCEVDGDYAFVGIGLNIGRKEGDSKEYAYISDYTLPQHQEDLKNMKQAFWSEFLTTFQTLEERYL